MLKVAVLVSGGGTNLQAIIDAIDNKVITDTEIVAVISNNKNAFALESSIITTFICRFPPIYNQDILHICLEFSL